MPSAIAHPVGRMCTTVLLAAALNSLILPLSGQAASPSAPPQRVPVLVELFTSEGCSDCPAADALLAKLDAAQPVSGAQAVVLSEHVTYWNRQGWTDPFSLDAMTERQEDYVRRFGLDSSYTPQMVVDGTDQFVGSDGRALLAAITKEANAPKQAIAIEGAAWDHGVAQFSVHASASAGTKLIAVLAADATHAEVARGENAGRTLHHTAVVRVMKQFGADSADGRQLKLPGGPLTQKTEASGPVRLVVFLVDRKTGHVLGAAQQTLQR
ncbi:MAG TPA: DUF1223 domain-containing protein [Terracidiphilus sp.]|nr:DUF1223 domain-containing protein [Terracidiphilus sp.]